MDTHVFLWAASAPDQLAPSALALLEDPQNEILFSVVSAWEIAIKQSLGKLELPASADLWVPQQLQTMQFTRATVSLEAALRVVELPWHHRDPFDRLLIAQAMEEQLCVLTRDPAFEKYEVRRCPA
ncbi:MAG TPA: type II toxin-antitoxin system VapC family toxin [Polyangiales bacterium]|nr:type II toxin-antitoxin system VapC family toxin [Polyangiales bacterium]